MIIPLGHDQTEVRRLPWVTFTIMGLCVLVHLLVTFAPGISESEIGQDLTEAVEYWMTHPWLELPPRLQEDLLAGFPEEEFEAWRSVLEQTAGARPAATVMAEQQVRLDELVEKSFAGIESLPLYKYGLVPDRPSTLTLFTHMFLHVGWLHLLGNLFFLYLTGPFIEDVWGRPVFLGFYLLGGLVSGGLFAMRYADLNIPLVGASGAIAACMGAFLIRYWHINIKFFYWIGFFFRGTFKAPAWLMLPLWLLRELFAATMMDSIDPSGRSGGTAFWAHVWGFGFGAGVALAMKGLKIEERFIHKAIEAKTTVVNNALLAEAMEAQDAGRTDEAMTMLGDEVKRSPGNAEAVLALWGVATAASRVDEAVPAMQRLLREEVRSGELDLALTHRAELAELAPDAPVEPAVEMRLAEHLLRDDQPDQAGTLLHNALGRLPGDASSGMLTRLARLACRANSGIGLAALERALDHPELPGDVREELAKQQTLLAARQPAVAGPEEAFTDGPTAVMDEDGISIPGYEPTSLATEESGDDTPAPAPAAGEPPSAAAFIPAVGGDAPVDPTVFEGFPSSDGIEEAGPDWTTGVPPVGGDAGPPHPVSTPESGVTVGERPLELTSGISIETAGDGDGEVAEDQGFIDEGMLGGSGPVLDENYVVGGDRPEEMEAAPAQAEQAAALGLELSPALADEPETIIEPRPGVVNDLPRLGEHPGAERPGPVPSQDSPVPEKPAAGGPASLRTPGTAVETAPEPAAPTSVMPETADPPTAGGPASLRTPGTIPEAAAPASVMPETADPPTAGGPASLRTPGTIPEAAAPASASPSAPAKQLERHPAEALGLNGRRMTLNVEGRGPSALGLDKVRAVSTAVIRPPGRPASIVIDLLLDPPWATGARLRVVRMSSDNLDPAKIIPEAPNSAAALRMMIDRLLAGSQGIPLPDSRAVKGKPFREFSSLGEYEREILKAS